MLETSKNVKIFRDDIGREYTTKRRLRPSSFDMLMSKIDVYTLLNTMGLLKKGSVNKTPCGDIYILCPLHGEKTPSCRVYLAQKKIHCFGCGFGGSIIDFYANNKQVSQLEAIQSLSHLFRVKGLQYENQKIDLFEILDGFQQRVQCLLYKTEINKNMHIAGIVEYLDFFEEIEQEQSKKETISQIRDFFLENGLTNEGLGKESDNFLNKQLSKRDYKGNDIRGGDIARMYIEARDMQKILEAFRIIRLDYFRDYVLYNATDYVTRDHIDILLSRLFRSGRYLEDTLSRIVEYCHNRKKGERYEEFRQATYGKSLEEVLQEREEN